MTRWGEVFLTRFDETLQRTTEALKKEGFGIITEIDIKQTLKEKIGAKLHWDTTVAAYLQKVQL